MFSIKRKGSILFCVLPAYLENPIAFCETLGILIDTLQYKVSYNDKEIAHAFIDRNASFNLDGKILQSGAYEIIIIAKNNSDDSTKEIWKQLVYFQPHIQRTPEQIDFLARKHAPILVFSRKEKYYPMALGDILGSATIKNSKQSINVDTIFGKKKIPLPELFEFLCHNGHSDYLLDQSFLSFRKSDFLELHGHANQAVIYYSYQEDKNSNRFFINYHKFYAYDPKTGIAKFLNVGPHIFDRESMSIVFKGDGTPESIVLSGHMENQTILLLDKLKIWNTGRVRIRHPDLHTATVEGHPIAMVAEGSHAVYPCAGLFHISVLSELAGHAFRRILPIGDGDDDEPPGMSANQALLPESLSSNRFSSYELRPLRLDLLQSEPHPDGGDLYDPDTCCLVFSGFWVDVPGPSNARFPPFTRRELEVEDWTDNAYDWDWDDLPEAVSKNNQAIADFIESHLND